MGHLRTLPICLLFSSVLLVGACEARSANIKPVGASSGTIAELNKNLAEFASDYLKTRLVENFRDPTAAQFSDLAYFVDYVVLISGTKLAVTHKLCGKVNGKNAYGGYVGFSPFYTQVTINPKNGDVHDETLLRTVLKSDASERQVKDFVESYRSICRNTERPN